MQRAMNDLDGASIDYVNTHGTSTPAGDLKEVEALRTVFGDAIPPFSSTKSLTGHALGAAGANEAIYTLLMMQNRFAAASANIDNLDPDMVGAPVIRERMDDIDIRRAMSNSFWIRRHQLFARLCAF